MSAGSHEILGSEFALRHWNKQMASRYEIAKAFFDVLAASALLLVVLPIVLVALILVRLTSRGSPIYRQRRVGRNGSPFTILKIRSMHSNSETDGPTWAVPGDQRVTLVGRFLRRSHIDELPQLINVIRGEMSLIGPRPERPELIAQLERALPGYHLRHKVRPGISGLAQVLQAPDTDLASVSRKLKYDIHYVDRLSLFLDAKIAVATALLFLAIPGRRIAALLRFPFHEPDLSLLLSR
jgi:lipopolysaccharide/colanic/teichoic acid biosynthesis glycosyltransferase